MAVAARMRAARAARAMRVNIGASPSGCGAGCVKEWAVIGDGLRHEIFDKITGYLIVQGAPSLEVAPGFES
jgi:hypothetical protein